MTDERFTSLVDECITQLPEWVRDKMVNVAIVVRQRPSKIQRRENDLSEDETLFGLYEGVPLPERGVDSPLMPDIITIFQEPILETYTSEADIKTCIDNTLWHELAHYFGYDEPWVEREEQRRGKIL
ncbi:MAG: metallopeptidase family protein [Candidatus Pacebacteria bacterium]|nr:metallopeptidase family protein [Candidatus Paceibacterota bacterium]